MLVSPFAINSEAPFHEANGAVVRLAGQLPTGRFAHSEPGLGLALASLASALKVCLHNDSVILAYRASHEINPLLSREVLDSLLPRIPSFIAIPAARFTNKRVLKWRKNIGEAEIIADSYPLMNQPIARHLKAAPCCR